MATRRQSGQRARIDELSAAERARFDEWADRWIEIGLRTGAADRPRFEAAVRECYRVAGLEPPRVIVWTTSPLAVALAGPIAAAVLALRRRAAVHDAVHDAVRDAVHDAVHGAVDGAVGGAVGGAVARLWGHVFGGQLWVGGWWWGGAWTSFFREVCGLALPGDLWDRARAYEATMESACWWWPHREFVIVSERPQVIHRELVDPLRPRGWGSHRLHAADGPAVVWPDGWGVWAWHGVRVDRRVIEAPETFTAAEILAQPNAEIRRVLLERHGMERFIDGLGARPVQEDRCGRLYRIELDEDEPLVLVRVVNSTPEPDGSVKQYLLRVPPDIQTAQAAVAWTFDVAPARYAPLRET